jgi:hypothetical protein
MVMLGRSSGHSAGERQAVAESAAAVREAEAEAAAAQRAADGGDLVGRLADRTKLRESGVPSAAEFEEAKARVLASG